MKKTILGTLMLCFSTSFSQNYDYGLKGDLNLSNLRGDYPTIPYEDVKLHIKRTIGFNFGGFIEYKINDRLSIQPELLISIQGNKLELISEYYNIEYYDDMYNYEYNKETFSQRPKLYYLNIPVLLKYKVFEKVNLDFGPQFGILLSAKSKWIYDDFNYPSEYESIIVDLLRRGEYTFLGESVIVKKGMKRFDLGLHIGMSYELNEKLFIQFRYIHGVSTIDEYSTIGDDYKSWRLKNRVFQLSVGYRIN